MNQQFSVIQKLLTHLRADKRGQFLLFCVVGGFNTIFAYSIFALFTWLGFSSALASLAQICIGALFNFISTGSIVFANKNIALVWRFVGVYLITYLAYAGTLRVLESSIPNQYIRGAILALPLAFLTFFLLKKFVFRQNTSSIILK